MIHTAHRFHGRRSLNYAYKNGRTLRGRYMALRYAAQPQRSAYRAAVVVSRKVSKSAVVRNRIRRRVFERVRILSSDFVAAGDCIFSVYDAQVADLPAGLVEREVVLLLSKAGMLPRNRATHGIVDKKD